MCLRVLSALLLLLLLPAVAVAQLSPGPLSSSHADLEGVLQCTRCHAIGLGHQELKCSSCHVEILDRVKNKVGYHAQVVDSSKGDADCVNCHTEHVGRDFELIRWPEPGQSGFDHNQTGYKLEGKHTALTCSQCHNAKNVAPDQKAGILIKDLDRTFLGLKTDCLSCHTDTHRGALGTNCTSCHSQDAWKPATRFDHRRTRFPLTGLHVTVSCSQCHIPEQGGSPNHFAGLNFSDCSGCHRDPHRGAFAASCSQCHSTSGWKVAANTLTSRFDHSRTRYPLTGKHAAVECASCHKNSNFSAPIATALCTDCHADKHHGQFAQRADGGDCASCHTVDGFDHSTFDIKAHAATKYPLLGKHAQAACQDCHPKTGDRTNYHPAFDSCSDCHQDAHQGQFAARYASRCEGCHTIDGFKPSTFTLDRHSETRFDLMGAHLAVACIECHKTGQDTSAHRYVFEDRSCTACHQDPHGLDAGQQQCETCHTLAAWNPPLSYDHNRTRFALLGAHRAVNCVSCHEPKTLGNEKHVQFRGAPENCSGCHDDIHGGQFGNRFGPDCNSCHSTLTWQSAAGFDHSRSAFPLDGAHRNVRCVLCHVPSSRPAGPQAVVYRDAPTECAKCH